MTPIYTSKTYFLLSAFVTRGTPRFLPLLSMCPLLRTGELADKQQRTVKQKCFEESNKQRSPDYWKQKIQSLTLVELQQK